MTAVPVARSSLGDLYFCGMPPDPYAAASLGPLELRNRFLKAATFEGLTPKHVVTDRLVEFHRVMAAGGVAMTNVAFCAVSPDGCGTPNEIILGEEASPGLERLAAAVHSEGAVICAQIGHAGAVAAATGFRGRAPSPMFSPMAMRRAVPVSHADIERITGDFASAARLLERAGFDAVEVHVGHGYLLSEFLSPKLNRRRDQWGGTLENRARFTRGVLEAVRRATDGRMAVIAKLNMADGVPGGFWVDESVEVGRMIQDDGFADALELTAGSSLENPMYLFRGEAPVREMSDAFREPIRTGFRVFGKRFFHEYPYEEAFLLPFARQFRAELSIPLVLLGGISKHETVELAMEEGFEFVALGRALLREPDLVNRFREGTSKASLCIHCNKCMPTIYRGTHCVLVPPEKRAGWIPKESDVSGPAAGRGDAVG